MGYNGGNGNGDYGGGGGGGAGGPGIGGQSGGIGTDGGPGVSIDISGSPVVYAAGGGGGSYNKTTYGAGGSSGVGGRGAAAVAGITAEAGAANTGSGGGGGGGDGIYATSGAGGSGIVVVRYLLAEPDLSLPQIANVGSENVTDTSADVVGVLITNGTSAATVTLYWSTTDCTNNATEWTTGGSSSNLGARADGAVFTNTLAGLTPGTTYYWNHSAVNASGTVWAATAGSPSFTTIGLPGVNNGSGATQVTAVKATLNGALTDGSQAYVTMYWGTADGATNAAAWAQTNSLGLLSEGSFASYATGLTSGVTYYYRCYATNGVGETWAAATTNFLGAGRGRAGADMGRRGGANDDWTLPANWVGDVMPGRPATSVVTFNDTGAKAQGVVSSMLDADWTLNGGLTFANTAGKYHTIDLGGNTLLVAGTLTLNGGGQANTTNGTLQLGQAGTPVNVSIPNGPLVVGSQLYSSFTNVYIGNLNHGVNETCLDLRNAVVTQTVFSATTLSLGHMGTYYRGIGNLYINDRNSVIDTLQVRYFTLADGAITMNAGADVIIGSESERGTILVGQKRVGQQRLPGHHVRADGRFHRLRHGCHACRKCRGRR